LAPRFPEHKLASRVFQRNDVPPRTVANSGKEKIRLWQTTNLESSNSASAQTANAGT
jgi:hypothetical protein